MSYCQLLGFKTGGFDVLKEFRNAHGWAAFVWDSLWKEYLNKGHRCTDDGSRFQELYDSGTLMDFERFILGATVESALVNRSDIPVFIGYLKRFMSKYKCGVKGRACHIPEIIGLLQTTEVARYLAVGWYGHSVYPNFWQEQGLDDLNGYDVNIGEAHFFVPSRIDEKTPQDKEFEKIVAQKC